MRAKRLAESVQQFNKDSLPFYLSVPRDDLTLFREHLAGIELTLLADEEILSANPQHSESLIAKMPGNHLQQVVKSEFWRLGLCLNYLMIDSDSYFIRSFGISDFMYDDVTPYTVMHEGKELLGFAARSGQAKIRRNFIKDRAAAQNYFGRPGRIYDFGPTPIICHADVWKRLSEDYGRAHGLSFAEMITLFPNEMLWYGEALLYYKPIPIMPVEPLFKVFHYIEQYEESLALMENEKVLAENYLGIINQSNWDKALDLIPKKKRSWKSLWLKR
ncbi:hypothetical protein KI809_14755 [Geobacter pelophilus]|uniref:Glycosyl transferase n=1 Tax=Geoanaerobacter pelophilus TaxID=60036 RepID=A0AAW4L3K4_9BACT|nr:hypothetical protein [Geoanaerobacter pelophilus]